MSKDNIREIAKKYALQNAIFYNGTANDKAVVGKVIAAIKKEKFNPKEIFSIVESIVQEVNKIPLKQQITALEKIAPELLQKEKKERDFSLPSLPFAEQGKVVTRFPPEPNGYLHIGHAKAAIIDCEYARLYDGKFILRFDDTNPENARLEFYEAQKKDLEWLGIKWDEEYNTSDHLEKHYELAQQLLEKGHAYVCKCPPEEIKKGRYHSKACSCVERSCGESLDLWKKLLYSGDFSGAIVRLHGEMNSPNTAMRDPTLFRVIDSGHPIQGDKYRVWPTYDFAGAIEDSISGVTHPFRTKEYELRDPVYFRILSYLNLRKPHLMEFSRLSIKGMPVSKRKIKPLIDKKLVTGYDDVRLPTLQGLAKRGITCEAIAQFVFSQGISKVEATVDFSILESFNRKILDDKVKRFYAVIDPIQIHIINAPQKKVTLPFHPSKDFGARTLTTKEDFFIQKEDAHSLKVGEVFRLKGLYNVKVLEIGQKIKGEFVGEQLMQNTQKLQWTTENYLPITLIIPSLIFENDDFNPDSIKEKKGYAEQDVAQLKSGEIIQFERIGFVRIEHLRDTILCYLAHK